MRRIVAMTALTACHVSFLVEKRQVGGRLTAGVQVGMNLLNLIVGSGY